MLNSLEDAEKYRSIRLESLKIFQKHSLPVMKKKKTFLLKNIITGFNRTTLLLTELLRKVNWLESLLYMKKSYIN